MHLPLSPKINHFRTDGEAAESEIETKVKKEIHGRPERGGGAKESQKAQRWTCAAEEEEEDDDDDAVVAFAGKGSENADLPTQLISLPVTASRAQAQPAAGPSWSGAALVSCLEGSLVSGGPSGVRKAVERRAGGHPGHRANLHLPAAAARVPFNDVPGASLPPPGQPFPRDPTRVNEHRRSLEEPSP